MALYHSPTRIQTKENEDSVINIDKTTSSKECSSSITPVIQNDVPPPGAYDPKFDTEVRGAMLDKSDRFQDNRSTNSTECNLSVCNHSSNKSGIIFRTPQPAKKPAVQNQSGKIKSRSILSSSDTKLKYTSDHKIADLQVECSNKNKTIEEYLKHIHEMQEEIQKLHSQLEELHKNQAEVEQRHQNERESMIQLQQEVLQEHIKRHRSEIELIQKQLIEACEAKAHEIQAKEDLESDLRSRISDFEKKIDTVESALTNQKRLSEDKIQSLVKQVEGLMKKIEKTSENHKEEVCSLEQKKLELNTCINNLTNKITKCEERLKRMIIECDTRVHVMVKEAKTAVEEEMRLTKERYTAYLTRIEKERSELDEKLSEKDAEINKLSIILGELKSSTQIQETFGLSLQLELDQAEAELAEKGEELQTLKNQIRKEATEMTARKKKLEATMRENQALVITLTKHLAENNTDVEKLQRELKRGEDSVNEHHELLTIMRNNSKVVHSQIHDLMKEFDDKRVLVNQLESEKVNKIHVIKSVFEAKIQDLKQLTTKEVTQLHANCDKKDAQNAEMKIRLQNMAERLDETKNMLLKLEKKNSTQELEISQLETINRELARQLEESKLEIAKSNNFLEAETIKYKDTLNEANVRIEELSNTVRTFEERRNNIEDKTELLEEEKARREAAEEEIRKLLEYNARLKKDHEEISEKYAELIGHQNHKQRIKHVSQLKDKITQLEMDLRKKTTKIEQQQKIIEKIRSEEKHVPNKFR
ncbi:uncharacterized protein LOC117228356 isoform X2 [Megalopta genalis]|uniref:uncharacterized protein LOC117228356 isoform X2 n=1 Tax=Megalopta genalis TaxID=115081 RepID=UPI003FD0B80B